jgi:hypothetical protein
MTASVDPAGGVTTARGHGDVNRVVLAPPPPDGRRLVVTALDEGRVWPTVPVQEPVKGGSAAGVSPGTSGREEARWCQSRNQREGGGSVVSVQEPAGGRKPGGVSRGTSGREEVRIRQPRNQREEAEFRLVRRCVSSGTSGRGRSGYVCRWFQSRNQSPGRSRRSSRSCPFVSVRAHSHVVPSSRSTAPEIVNHRIGGPSGTAHSG